MFNMAICDDDPFVLEEMERLMEIYQEALDVYNNAG